MTNISNKMLIEILNMFYKRVYRRPDPNRQELTIERMTDLLLTSNRYSIEDLPEKEKIKREYYVLHFIQDFKKIVPISPTKDRIIRRFIEEKMESQD